MSNTQVEKQGPIQEDTDMKTSTLFLKSKDGVDIAVPRRVALLSGLVKDMVEGDGEDDECTIPLPNVDSAPLRKLVQFMEYHIDNPMDEIEKPLKGKIEDVICEFDKKWLEVDQNMLIQLIMASNYMNLKPALDLTCAKVASMIKGKTPEQIREIFGIENDFTPEEEEKIREENKWCEDA